MFTINSFKCSTNFTFFFFFFLILSVYCFTRVTFYSFKNISPIIHKQNALNVHLIKYYYLFRLHYSQLIFFFFYIKQNVSIHRATIFFQLRYSQMILFFALNKIFPYTEQLKVLELKYQLSINRLHQMCTQLNFTFFFRFQYSQLIFFFSLNKIFP